jgi:hypothetical protein
MESRTATPKLSLQITTYEFYEGMWNPTVTHTFYGETAEELRRIKDAHKKTDSFFNASFIGKVNGIVLMNGNEIISELSQHM